MGPKRTFSKSGTILVRIIIVLFGSLVGFTAVEVAARLVEPMRPERDFHVRHPVLGWIPASGNTTRVTQEYVATYDVNSLGMNDSEIDERRLKAKLRIMAIGDSNTFGQGVSQQEAWPKVLEGMLFGGNKAAGTVYNLGVIGYSLGQYLLRMRELESVLDPQIIIIGFSMHTDLYDLIPPRLGGFAYEKYLGRVYFDLDENENLVEVRDLMGRDLDKGPSQPKRSLSLRMREFLGWNSALYRRYRRSNLAIWVAAHWQPGGQSLMPGIDTAIKRNLSPEDEFRWRLAERILHQIATEARQKERKILLVNIPYLPQAYDDIWAASFGRRPEVYDRWIAGERLARICTRTGIYFVDTTRRFVEEARRRKAWLHYREDRHPTVEGHRIIAEEVARGLAEDGLLAKVKGKTGTPKL